MTLKSVVNVVLVLALLQAFPTGDAVRVDATDVTAYAVQAQTGLFPLVGDRGPRKTDDTRLGVVTDAASVLVRDVESGVVLTARGADEVRAIASVTKLMTALVALESPSFDASRRVTVLREDVREGGRWYVRFGDDISMGELVDVMIVGSGNNETVALVRELGMGERAFVEAMNARARALGMRHTQFADAVGLSARTVSTARDVAILLDAALARPELAARMRMGEVRFESARGNVYRVSSTDALLESFINKPPFAVVGGKTGYTDDAGACLTVRVERDGHAIDVTVLGASTVDARFADVKALASWVFDVYEW